MKKASFWQAWTPTCRQSPTWVMLRYAPPPQKFFSVTDSWDFATNLLCTPLSSIDYFQNLQGLPSKNQASDGTSEGKFPSPWAQAWAEAIWDTGSQAGHRSTYRSASETPKGLVSVWTGYGAAVVRTSVPTRACLVISHITTGLHSAQPSQQHLAIGGAGKSFSKPAKDFCLAWKTSCANSAIQNNLIFWNS